MPRLSTECIHATCQNESRSAQHSIAHTHTYIHTQWITRSPRPSVCLSVSLSVCLSLSLSLSLSATVTQARQVEDAKSILKLTLILSMPLHPAHPAILPVHPGLFMQLVISIQLHPSQAMASISPIHSIPSSHPAHPISRSARTTNAHGHRFFSFLSSPPSLTFFYPFSLFCPLSRLLLSSNPSAISPVLLPLVPFQPFLPPSSPFFCPFLSLLPFPERDRNEAITSAKHGTYQE